MTIQIFQNKRRLAVILMSLAVLTGIFVVLNNQKWFHDFIERKVSALVGRDFAVDGDIDVDWDWTTPGLSVKGIRIANVPEGKEPSMVKIKELDFHIRIWRLLRLELNFPEVAVSAPEIVLEKFSKTRTNWDFPLLSGANMAKQALPDDRTEVPIIDLLKISDGKLVYRDDPKKLSINLRLESIKGQMPNQGLYVIKGDGLLQGQAFRLAAEGGSVAMLRAADKPYPLKIDIAMGTTRATVDGQFADPVKMQGVDARLDIRGPSLADLFYLTQIPLPPSPPYRLKGVLKQDNKVWRFSDFSGRLGDSDLGGDLSYDTAGERGYIKANLVSRRLDFDDLSGLIGATPKSGTLSPQQKKEAKAEKASPKLLPDTPVNLTRLRSADMNVRLKAKRIKAPSLPLDDLDIGFNLRNGVLTLDPLQFGVADGSVGGSLTLDGQRAVPAVRANLTIRRLGLKQFFAADSSFKSLSTGRFGGLLKLSGNGKTVADILADSNGKITLLMSGGKIDLLLIEAAGLDLGDALPLILGNEKSTDIRCMIGDFTVRDGLLKSDTLVFDTADSNINGSLSTNFKTEQMNGKIEVHPKDFSILSARTPILLSGTLKKPSVSLEKKELLIKGAAAAALGALLTPVGALIPFIELGLGKDSDCAGLIRQARRN